MKVDVRSNQTRISILRIVQVAAWGSGIAILCIMFLTTADVIGRYLGYPIKGAMEISEMSLVVLGFLAFGYTQLYHRNVTIELVTSRLSKHTKAVLSLITSILSMGVFGIMAWSMAMRAWKYILKPGTAPSGDILSLPFLPFMCVAAIGVFILFLVLVLDLLKSIYEVSRKEGGQN
jgi:TRAP-type C4-dicarboxylate transport system permease small subunit